MGVLAFQIAFFLQKSLLLQATSKNLFFSLPDCRGSFETSRFKSETKQWRRQWRWPR